MSGFLAGLKERAASTDPRASEPGLRGRTYAIPFERVWQTSIQIVGGGIRGWSLIRSNDQAGSIEALVQPGPLSKHVDIRISVGLDEMAQTRVDMSAVSRTERGDLGRARRLVERFFDNLDEKLGAGPGEILDPARLTAFAAGCAERGPTSPTSPEASLDYGEPEGDVAEPSSGAAR